jgi:chemotaxis signal transduction protein
LNGVDHAAEARRMREEFDGSFALPIRTEAAETDDLLAVRLRGDGFALRTREIAGLAVGRKIVPLPGPVSACLGLAGVRGALIPAWDTAFLLGYGGPGSGARWLALGRGEEPWALAFDGLDGFFRVPRSDIRPGGESGGGTRFARETCAVGGCERPVIDLPLILETIRTMSDSNRVRRQ